jgi:hypothetical protein
LILLFLFHDVSVLQASQHQPTRAVPPVPLNRGPAVERQLNSKTVSAQPSGLFDTDKTTLKVNKSPPQIRLLSMKHPSDDRHGPTPKPKPVFAWESMVAMLCMITSVVMMPSLLGREGNPLWILDWPFWTLVYMHARYELPMHILIATGAVMGISGARRSALPGIFFGVISAIICGLEIVVEIFRSRL